MFIDILCCLIMHLTKKEDKVQNQCENINRPYDSKLVEPALAILR